MKNYRLMKKLDEHKLSRADIAFDIERSVSYISSIVTNRINLVEEEKYILAKALNCKVKDIF
jgi:hypothetical protein